MSKQLVGVMRLEKRTAKRFESSLQVLFVWQGRVVQATAIDVSMTGMRLTCEVDLEKGTELAAHFAPEGGRATHQLEGQIVWSRPSEEIAGIYIAGLHFSVLPEDTAEQLAALVRTLGGEHAMDDLPVVEAEEVAHAPPPEVPAAKTPAPRSAALPEEQTPSFAAMDQPQPGAAAPPVDAAPADPFGAAGSSGEEPWRITEQLEVAVAADYRQREENRETAKQHLTAARQAKEAGDLKRALPLLREAADLVPDSPDIFEELAATVYLVGDVVESAKLFDKALRLRMERGD